MALKNEYTIIWGQEGFFFKNFPNNRLIWAGGSNKLWFNFQHIFCHFVFLVHGFPLIKHYFYKKLGFWDILKEYIFGIWIWIWTAKKKRTWGLTFPKSIYFEKKKSLIKSCWVFLAIIVPKLKKTRSHCFLRSSWDIIVDKKISRKLFEFLFQ